VGICLHFPDGYFSFRSLINNFSSNRRKRKMSYQIPTPPLSTIMKAIMDELQRQEDFWGLVIVAYDYERLIKILMDDNAKRYGVQLDEPVIDIKNDKTDLQRRLKRAMFYFSYYLHLERHQYSPLLTLKLDLIKFLKDLKKVPLSY
jgi:hypothetical protein